MFHIFHLLPSVMVFISREYSTDAVSGEDSGPAAMPLL